MVAMFAFRAKVTISDRGRIIREMARANRDQASRLGLRTWARLLRTICRWTGRVGFPALAGTSALPSSWSGGHQSGQPK